MTLSLSNVARSQVHMIDWYYEAPVMWGLEFETCFIESSNGGYGLDQRFHQSSPKYFSILIRLYFAMDDWLIVKNAHEIRKINSSGQKS